MNFYEYKLQYIAECKGDEILKDGSIIRYQYLLNVYEEYVDKFCKENEVNVQKYFGSVDVSIVLDAIEYYVENRRVKSIDTMNMYKSVICEFHKFLRDRYGVTNDGFFVSLGLKSTDSNSFMYQYDRFCRFMVDNKKIKIAKASEVFSEQEICNIVRHCNSLIAEYNPNGNVEEEFNRYVRAIIVKLIIYTGASVAQKIYPLKVEAYDKECGTLDIDGYKVHLPYHLRNNMNTYVTELIPMRGKKDLLFSDYRGTLQVQPHWVGSLYSYIVKNDGKRNASTISLAKYAIVQMIEAGMDRDIIQEFTGYGDEVYVSCKEYVEMILPQKDKKIVDEVLKTRKAYDIL